MLLADGTDLLICCPSSVSNLLRERSQEKLVCEWENHDSAEEGRKSVIPGQAP